MSQVSSVQSVLFDEQKTILGTKLNIEDNNNHNIILITLLLAYVFNAYNLVGEMGKKWRSAKLGQIRVLLWTSRLLAFKFLVNGYLVNL